MLRRGLSTRGVAWPESIVWRDVLHSTSETLKELARAGAPEFATVLAEEQTRGYGRQGSAWLSPRGNLFVSVLARPEPGLAMNVLPLAVGVSVRDALVQFGVSASVKWPNDVLAGGRKVAGILVEAVWSEGFVDSVVIGIGANVGLSREQLPEDLADETTSVFLETGQAPEVAEVAAETLARLRLWYHELANPGAVVAAWKERSVSWWGRAVEIRCAGESLKGIARGIDDSGALVLQLADGTSRTVLAGAARELRLR